METHRFTGLQWEQWEVQAVGANTVSERSEEGKPTTTPEVNMYNTSSCEHTPLLLYLSLQAHLFFYFYLPLEQGE